MEIYDNAYLYPSTIEIKLLAAASRPQAPRGGLAGWFLMRLPQHHRQPDQLLDANPGPAPWKRLDRVALADLRKLWWRLRRRGVRMPAEPGVIVIDGRRASENPSPPIPAVVDFDDEVGIDG